MKTNLDGLFKGKESFENEGVWFAVGEAEFLLRRFGGSNKESQKAMAKFHKPLAKQIERGLVPDDIAEKAIVKAFVHGCMLDWKNVEIDGEAKEFNADIAVELLTAMPDLASVLIENSSEVKHYQEDLGNS